MNLAYISPSALPSRSANSVHVMLQCDALARLGVRVTLFAKRTVREASALRAQLESTYGIDARRLDLRTYYSSSARGDLARIAAMSVASRATRQADVVLSRNMYAAFALGVIARRRMLFETHQLELGFRKPMQKAIMLQDAVTTVVISTKLAECLTEYHGAAPSRHLVLHDAAPAGIDMVPVQQRRGDLGAYLHENLQAWQLSCGYFGQLYAGRGIELIEEVAARSPQCLFLVFGGSDAEVQQRRVTSRNRNVRYMGHVPRALAGQLMGMMDVLLMPYQESVSIGVAGHDTARWMSPMKMFEYMASGAAIVSSDLPVLREVLVDGHNCLLAPAADAAAWSDCVERLAKEIQLRERLGRAAHADYESTHTWTKRAEALLAAGTAK